MRLTTSLSIGIGAILVAAAACGGGQPAPPPEPVVDSAAIRDSIARAEARRRAVQDSLERARREAERIAAQRRADSIARIEAETRRMRDLLAARIHFDFDKSDIRPSDAAILDQKIQVLQANPNLRIRIVGHCDERGSDEYNIALGNRRAVAAKQYMVSRGIAADRIDTDSMGEEQPLDPRSTEEAWTQNRRDEFEILAGGDVIRAPTGL